MKYALSLVPVLALGLVACSGGSGTLQLTSSLPSNAPLTIGDGTLVVDSARIAVSAIEFEDESGWFGSEVELGAAVIEVNVDGNETVVAASNVDAGSYNVVGLEFSPGGGDGAAFADFNDGEASSLIITGTYAGEAFTYRSTINPEVEFGLEPPVEVADGGEATVSVTIDVAAWFTAADGSVLDPTDSGSRGTIDGNILAALEAAAVDFERDASLDGD